MIYEEEITRKKYKNNNYKNFIKILSIDNRVNVITFKLNELKENSKTINILENIESNVINTTASLISSLFSGWPCFFYIIIRLTQFIVVFLGLAVLF